MGLFKPDFYRSFAIGFALGAVAVFGSLGSSAMNTMVPQAVAASAR